MHPTTIPDFGCPRVKSCLGELSVKKRLTSQEVTKATARDAETNVFMRHLPQHSPLTSLLCSAKSMIYQYQRSKGVSSQMYAVCLDVRTFSKECHSLLKWFTVSRRCEAFIYSFPLPLSSLVNEIPYFY